MRKYFLFFSLASILFLSGCLFRKPSQDNVSQNSFFSEKSQLSDKSQINSAADEDNSGGSEEAVKDKGSSDTESDDVAYLQGPNIIVESPTKNELLSSPIVVSGKARVFENTVNVDVKKEDNEVLISEVVNVHPIPKDSFGEFSVNIYFQFFNTDKGSIDVYSISAKDGSKENLVNIPVRFETTD